MRSYVSWRREARGPVRIGGRERGGRREDGKEKKGEVGWERGPGMRDEGGVGGLEGRRSGNLHKDTGSESSWVSLDNKLVLLELGLPGEVSDLGPLAVSREPLCMKDMSLCDFVLV